MIPLRVVKLGIGAGAVVALWLGFSTYTSSIYNRGHAAAVKERKAADDAKFLSDIQKAAADAKTLADDRDRDARERLTKEREYEERIDKLTAAARRGNSGLRAPGPSVPTCAPRDDPGHTTRPAAPEGFKLMPETAESVLSAARDHQRDMRDYNALAAAYERIRMVCNAQ